MRLKADLTLFIIAIIWGSAFVAQRVAGQMGSVYLFNGTRFLLGGLIVFPFAIQNKTIDKLSPDQWFWMLVAGIILFVAAALQQAGLLYTSAGNAGFITSLYVVLVPVVLFIFWRETPHWLAIVAICLAAVGAFLLSSNGTGFKLQPGDGLELIGAGLWTCHV
ncbi:MAG TPA: DMT family transporter, partial [Anaerolineales bacterium]|nr:DMT family transporter [Anaerolineales bacterium]